jgi:hypothetical protein
MFIFEAILYPPPPSPYPHTHPILPTSYGIASIFMAVFAAIIDTIFICFLVDCEHNKDTTMLASKSLQELVGKVCCLLRAVCCLLSAVCFLMYIVCCVLSAICYLLSACTWPLCTGCCLLPAAISSL